MTDLFSEPGVEPETSRPGRSPERTARRRAIKRRKQRRRNLITFTVMLVALALLVGGAWVLVRPLLSGDGETSAADVTDYPGPGTGEATVVVNPGESGGEIGASLVEADVVASVDAFVAAYSANADATSIQAGTYSLAQQMSAGDAVAALLDPGSRSDLTVTIPEGWRASQIYARVAEVLGVPVEDVEAAAAQLELPEEAGGEIEGWLFASTYTVAPDSTPDTVLQQMLEQTVAVLDDLEVPAGDREQVLNIASIAEAEVPYEDEWPRVTRVIANRLDGCSGDGTLGMDTTYAYGLDTPAAQITQSQWAEAVPYNTREVPGLPPTPIGSPGRGAIEAALQPADGDWCYFVTVDLESGETKFTDDYDEFLEFREEFREWVAAQPDSDG